MGKKIDIKGELIPNDYAWFYDWLEADYTSPQKVNSVIESANGEDIDVYINSPGGVVDVGSEIYTALRNYKGKVNINIVGQACSAASVVAMAGHCAMSPVALMMIHCVSTRASGNSQTMQHAAEMLSTADEALCSAYVNKTGKSKEEILEMMRKETWLNAEKAKEYGLIDEIMFEESGPEVMSAAGGGLALPPPHVLNKLKNLLDIKPPEKEAFYMPKNKAKAQLELLKMKGESK